MRNMRLLQPLMQDRHLSKPKIESTAEFTQTFKRLKVETNEIAKELIVLVRGTSEEKVFTRMLHCADILTDTSAGITTYFCKNRLCKICNRNRTQMQYAKYVDYISKIKQLQLITLTNFVGFKKDLNTEINEMKRVFKNVREQYRKRGQLLSGIWKFETVIEMEQKIYNIHFHVIIEGSKEVGETIKDKWLKYFISAKEHGQLVETINPENKKKVLSYLSKEFYKVDFSHPNSAKALHKVYNALYKQRLFQAFGDAIKAKKVVAKKRAKSEIKLLSKSSFFIDNWYPV